ncbi:hypothetical protein [Gluconacetobacter entanii]|uniref:hypothetical protein n=1 Tax=Gluconacetobacter entanii TaxID=108528 RepID=UPI0021BBD8D6|nr:hypothetical protein [Gluconacetobacter entanii]MCW4579768.1 hypothetical protein [Gluconacetobacter entanii]MCW4583168.1 hypothetical protein [Gluconacetobacter entanii]
MRGVRMGRGTAWKPDGHRGGPPRSPLSAIVLGAALLFGGGGTAMAADWPDTPMARMRMQAEIRTLQVALLTQPSATVTLEDWCARHAMATPARVLARRLPETRMAIPAQVRADLGVGADEPVRHRRVALSCGSHVLSLADNWYVPARLTPAMNARLEQTDVPFGHVVADLGFTRRTLDSTLLWSPLPAGWEAQALPPPSSGAIVVPGEILRNRAVLSRHDGVAFSEVVETYTGAILEFTPPA